MISFTVPGPVRGKGRPRFVRATGRTYTDAETASYENLIKTAAQLRMDGRAIFDGPVSMALVIWHQAPVSVSQKRYAAMIANEIRPMVRPDLDNVLKLVADALNGIVYLDDKQVSHAVVIRKYARAPSLEVSVTDILVDRIINTS